MIWAAVGAAAFIAAAAVILLLVFLKKNREEKTVSRRDISVSEKGVDVRSGQLGGGASYLNGMPGERIQTIRIEGRESENYKMEQKNIVLRDPLSGNVFCAVFRRELVIGRKAPRQEEIPFLKIQDPAVSGNHCRIFTDAAGFWAEDLNSTNGTFVNGQLVQGIVPLRGGDRLKIGSTEYFFEIR